MLAQLLSAPILSLYNNKNLNFDIFLPSNFLIFAIFTLVAYFKVNLNARANLLESPSKLAPLMCVGPVYAFLMDTFIFKIEVHMLSLIGSVIVVASAVLIMTKKK